MICQACGKRNATTHVKTVVNGDLCEYSLCGECARKLGYGNLFAELGRGLNLLGVQPQELREEERCSCGATWDDIVRTGRVGCAKCYETFYTRLLPVVERIHGSSHHRGKTPEGNLPQVAKERKTGMLLAKKQQLKEAIEAENFEDAVTLRDEIRMLEAKHDE
jgi:protein arginine kinase activator